MDIWSIGCVFFEVLSLQPVFPGSNELDQISRIHDTYGTPQPELLAKFKKSRAMDFNFPKKTGTGIEHRLAPCKSSKPCIKFINDCCTYDPDERLSAKQALKHSYFKDLWDLDHTPDPANELIGDIAAQGTEANDKTPHRKTFKRRRKPRHRDGTEFSTAVASFDRPSRNHLPALVSGPSGMVLPPIMKPKQSKPQHRKAHDSLFGGGYPSQLPAIQKRGTDGGGLS
jgi:serine/threonine protein kinase